MKILFVSSKEGHEINIGTGNIPILQPNVMIVSDSFNIYARLKPCLLSNVSNGFIAIKIELIANNSVSLKTSIFIFYIAFKPELTLLEYLKFFIEKNSNNSKMFTFNTVNCMKEYIQKKMFLKFIEECDSYFLDGEWYDSGIQDFFEEEIMILENSCYNYTHELHNSS